MKRIAILFAASLLSAACAKSVTTTDGRKAKMAFDAWVEVHNDGWTKTDLGSYIISRSGGEGDVAGDAVTSPYTRLNYTISDLNGNVTSTSDEMTARRNGIFNYQYYFGPDIFLRSDNAMFAGIDEIVSTMKKGEKCKFVIPGWLLTSNRHDTVEGYIDSYDGSMSNAIYEMELVEAIPDIEEWEIGQIEKYIAANCPDAKRDTNGFYKAVLKEPLRKITNDSTVYIHYTGRMLDGHVFDTSIRDTAAVNFKKDFNPAAVYSPKLINWKTDYTKISMTSSESSVIPGFAYLLGTMGVYEKSVGIFYSTLGYGAEGSSIASTGMSVLPSYCPLIFEVELVDKP